jgi:phage shock protein PspC (stress-responsive transcriptional regulator)
MKKTVTVNISGIVFTMDEDAYDALQKYLSKIKGYFRKSDGQEEIIADIEARIAEMFHEKIDAKFQVISILHVEEMMTIMGKPEDFIDEEQKNSEQEQQETKQQEPNTNNEKYHSKRLFRDKDGNVLGGVCSGVGYYFGFEPIWLRLIFAGLFFFGGTGFVFYLLLWIIIPEAKSTAEKLEMKGEPVNIDNIGKAIEDEMDNLKTKFSDSTTNWRQHIDNRRARNFIHRFFDFTTTILKAIINAFGKIIGVGLIIFGVITLMPVFFSFLDSSDHFLSWLTDGASSFSIPQIITLIFGTEGLSILAIIAFSLFIGIPAIAVIYGGIKLVLGVKQEIKGLGIAVTSLWIIGIMLMCYSGYKLSYEFKSKNEHTEIVSLNSSVGDTLNLYVSKDFSDMSNRKRHRNRGEITELLEIDDNIIYNGSVELKIEQADQDSFKIEVIRSSRGKTKSNAAEYAKDIDYSYKISGDNITFDQYLTTDITNSIRGQRVEITIYVPQGKSIYFSEDMLRIIHDIHNYTNSLDRDMPNKVWTMTKRGLECIGCDENEL